MNRGMNEITRTEILIINIHNNNFIIKRNRNMFDCVINHFKRNTTTGIKYFMQRAIVTKYNF